MNELKYDMINNPQHYQGDGGVDCLTAMKSMVRESGFSDHLRCQVLKYIWRYQSKGSPVNDLKKAAFYLDRLIKVTEDEAETQEHKDQMERLNLMAKMHHGED